mmetsp:Transcript_33976/g.83501  ORF Transcript_33976/g.83501 Transcript_33976/m.83501 type:complete len:373 (-) Transcript_33976:1546-2664(-)
MEASSWKSSSSSPLSWRAPDLPLRCLPVAPATPALLSSEADEALSSSPPGAPPLFFRPKPSLERSQPVTDESCGSASCPCSSVTLPLSPALDGPSTNSALTLTAPASLTVSSVVSSSRAAFDALDDETDSLLLRFSPSFSPAPLPPRAPGRLYEWTVELALIEPSAPAPSRSVALEHALLTMRSGAGLTGWWRPRTSSSAVVMLLLPAVLPSTLMRLSLRSDSRSVPSPEQSELVSSDVLSASLYVTEATRVISSCSSSSVMFDAVSPEPPKSLRSARSASERLPLALRSLALAMDPALSPLPNSDTSVRLDLAANRGRESGLCHTSVTLDTTSSSVMLVLVSSSSSKNFHLGGCMGPGEAVSALASRMAAR